MNSLLTVLILALTFPVLGFVVVTFDELLCSEPDALEDATLRVGVFSLVLAIQVTWLALVGFRP